MISYHRVPGNAVSVARSAVAAAAAEGEPIPEIVWRVAAGVATREDLVDMALSPNSDLVAAAATASNSVAIAELLNEASEIEAAKITEIAAMLSFGWDRALQQAESRAKTKLAKSQRRNELPFTGWPNAAVVSYLGADGLVHGQFEVLARRVAESVALMHRRFSEIAAEIAAVAGVAAEPPQDRSDELAAVLLSMLRARAMAFMAGQVRGFDPSAAARNIVAYAAHRSMTIPGLLDEVPPAASAYMTASWVEGLGLAFGAASWQMVWRHAFYRVPDTPFVPHVAMNGRVLTYDDLLAAGVWPGDHPFCTCALLRRWSAE